MASVRDEEEVVVGEDLANGLVIVYVDIPLDGINNVMMKIVGTAGRFMVASDSLMKERSLEVSMREVREQGRIGVVRAIVVVVVVDGI